MARVTACAVCFAVALAAKGIGCGGDGGGTGSGRAGDVARKLGRTPHFLIGMGNDLANDHARTAPTRSA
jgi:hypothetical protein